MKPIEVVGLFKQLLSSPSEIAPQATELGHGAGGDIKVEPQSPFAAFQNGDFAPAPPVELAFPEHNGIPFDAAADVIESNRALVNQALKTFVGKKILSGFEELLFEFIVNCAKYMGNLPASRTYHHSYRGGLFTHSMKVATSALHMASGCNVVYGSSPRERDADNLAWQLSVFISALLHDIGKIHTIGQVQATGIEQDPTDSGFRPVSAPQYDTIWHPSVESFEGWAKLNRVQSYYIDYEEAEQRPHTGYTERYFTQIVPTALRAFLYKSNPVIVTMLEDFIRNPQSSADTPLFKLVHDADHMDVAISLHPRKRPGSVDAAGLLWRRLTEYAHSSSWNLPTSPFIRAHVELPGKGSKRYVQIPFFVATEANVAGFLNYIESEEKFGVMLGSKIEQVVFTTLESATHFNRTLGEILPDQITPRDMPSHIPASDANVLFMPVREGVELTGQKVSQDPVNVTLPVIPLGGIISSGKTQHMPTLSFYGQPSNPMGESYPLAIIGGQIKPEDPAQEHDAAHLAKIEELISRNGLEGAEADAFRSVGKTPVDVAFDPRQVQSSRKKPKPFVVPQEDAEAEPISSADAAQEDLEQIVRFETQANADEPLWVKVYKAKQNDPRIALWASVWFYFHSVGDGVITITPSEGIYGFYRPSLSPKWRGEFSDALHNAQCDFALFGDNWPLDAFGAKSENFDQYFKINNDRQMMAKPELAEFIDLVCDVEGFDANNV